ncbi:ATP-dependent DNA helicase RecG [Gordonia sihwensis]|uniref:ATP-dependent DNA helicase RecG n=1 Tax=Gordonia sihwensis TaxID=173559 RepID=UPI0006981BAD|nr:ATP-dependent DNA helicase RecG [Gordonia sihwensis]
MTVQTLSRVQSAYLQHAARQLLRVGIRTRAIVAAAERPQTAWPPALVAELIDDIHHADADSAGIDLARIPVPREPQSPPQNQPAPQRPPSRAAERAADDSPWPTGTAAARPAQLRVPDTAQLRSSADILAPIVGTEPIVFDGTIDSLRGAPITDLSDQVGAPTMESLTGGGVDSIFDLLMRIPRTYIDRSTLTPLAQVRPGADVAFTGVVSGITRNFEKRFVRFRITDGPATITCSFFNALWMAQRIPDRSLVIVQGHVGEYNGTPRMTSPVMERLEDASAILIPIYPQTTIKDAATGKRDKGLSTGMLRTATIAALQRIPALDDPIPADLVARRQVLSRLDALRAVHVPDSVAHADAGRSRLAYDELLRLQLALGVIRNAQAAQPGITHRPTGTLLNQWKESLPYRLTAAQDRALDQIRDDLVQSRPMNRLLQGDVGAGKSNVLIGSALMAIESGYQVALLAPTEILARQLFDEIAAAFAPLGRTVDLLVSKHLPRPRKKVLASLEAGTVSMVVGTHSILSANVVFSRLGLAMIDEQHRFGVDQRALLADKGPAGTVPDILQATATPIPRTSAITTYGDMAVTVLDEKPAGRSEIDTHWIPTAALDNPTAPPWQAIRHQVAQGRQAFVVCSRVETGPQSETKDAAAAVSAAADLTDGALHGLRVAVTHGKQKPDERSQVMTAFKNGDIDVLVATTVIEVGVSVPNATVMVVLDANKFGLAQLHQIRGRVGRGQHPGQCWLVTDSDNDDAVSRMEAMTGTTDGFKLAELDLEIRGAGALTGTEQSGHDAGLIVADLLRDARIHLAARQDARHILEHDPHLNRHLTLKREVELALGADARYLTRG